jgi:2'-5' RNA ligase
VGNAAGDGARMALLNVDKRKEADWIARRVDYLELTLEPGFDKTFADAGADLKIVETENIHITLRFLGEISKDLVEKTRQEMENLKFDPFEVELKGAGAFPNLSRINVIWIGIQKGALELSEIFSQLESKLRKTGFQLDNRGFSPHITIGRVKSGRNKDALYTAINEMSDREFGSMMVNSIRLKKSTLTPKGPVYLTIYEHTKSQ